MNKEDMILISVDDHIVEPPDMYDNHLSQAHKAIKPELKKDKNGADYWLYEGRRVGEDFAIVLEREPVRPEREAAEDLVGGLERHADEPIDRQQQEDERGQPQAAQPGAAHSPRRQRHRDARRTGDRERRADGPQRTSSRAGVRRFTAGSA